MRAKRDLKKAGRRGGKTRARKLSPARRAEIARQGAYARWRKPPAAGTEPPNGTEPEIIGRLCERLDRKGRPLEYAFIKVIVTDAPLDELTALRLHPNSGDPFGKLLRAKTYEQILRALRSEEEKLAGLLLMTDDIKSGELARLAYLRLDVFQGLLSEPELLRQVRPRVLIGSGTASCRLQLWANKAPQQLLGEAVIQQSEEYAARFVRAAELLLTTHCQWDRLMRLRFRSAWWTKRPRPEAFPAVTKYLVPRLYDYLRPFYDVGAWDGERGPGAYPRQLMKDLADVLRLERPGLCAQLTWGQVLAAVKRYLEIAPPDRPLGHGMFTDPLEAELLARPASAVRS